MLLDIICLIKHIDVNLMATCLSMKTGHTLQSPIMSIVIVIS